MQRAWRCAVALRPTSSGTAHALTSLTAAHQQVNTGRSTFLRGLLASIGGCPCKHVAASHLVEAGVTPSSDISRWAAAASDLHGVGTRSSVEFQSTAHTCPFGVSMHVQPAVQVDRARQAAWWAAVPTRGPKRSLGRTFGHAAMNNCPGEAYSTTPYSSSFARLIGT